MKVLSTFTAILLANQALAAATGRRDAQGSSVVARSGKPVKRCAAPAAAAPVAEYVPEGDAPVAEYVPEGDAPVAEYIPGDEATSAVATDAAATDATATDATATEPAADGESVQKTGGGAGGHQVIYSDKLLPQNAIPEASYLGGFNRFILAFYLADGRKAFDNAAVWGLLEPAVRKETIESYHAAGIQVMVSAFGATDHPTTMGVDAKAFAKEVADWTLANDLDGVDCDYEDTTALVDGSATQWLIDFTTALREALGPDKLISHAPMAAWFSPAHPCQGRYGEVHKAVGDMIDFYNLQYYNSDTYLDCTSMIEASSDNPWPGSTLTELNEFGIPWEKLVLGKPIDPTAANNGFMEPAEVGKCLDQVVALGGQKNVMYWEMKSGVDHAAVYSAVMGA